MAARAPAVAPLAGLAALAAVLGLCLAAALSQTTAPRGAAGTGWDAQAGRATLTTLLAEETPHPVGSPANRQVRDRILARLTAAGYAPDVDARLFCTARAPNPGCARVENIAAVRRGTRPGEALLVTTHYDSVPAGPGASDAGSAVAILLHLAEAMKTATPRNDVIFLFTDAEEVGLRGAGAFAAHDPRFATVKTVLNVEARGAAGPSYMFETGPGNSALMALYARNVARPVTSSLAYEVYRILPNDTDFSIYRDAGRNGFNLAFVGSASVYHSREDRPGNLDADTFQHHGDTVFALAKALAATDLSSLQSKDDVSYFDVAGRFLVLWPNAWNLPLAALAVIGALAAGWRARASLTRAQILWAVAALIATPPLLFAVGWLLRFPLALWPGALPTDHQAPWPARIALVCALATATWLIALLCAPRAGWRALLIAGWLATALLALATALTLPGGAYAVLWPAVVFAVLANAPGDAKRALTAAGAAGALIACFFWMNHFLALEVVLGFPHSSFKLLALFPLALVLLGLFARLAPTPGAGAPALAAAGLATLVSAAVAATTTPVTPTRPLGLNIVYAADGQAAPVWIAQFSGRVDRGWLAANGFSATTRRRLSLGVFDSRDYLRPAAPLPIAPPRFDLLKVETSNGLQRYAGVLHPGAGGASLRIASDAQSPVQFLSVEDQPVWTAPPAGGQARALALSGLGPGPVRMTIAFAPGARKRFWLTERSLLPDAPEPRALTSARPANAAPIHSGDAALVSVRVNLP